MTKSINIFLLFGSLLVAGCGCDNSDLENGIGKREDIEPKFTLALGEGAKKEDLNTSSPIPLVLRCENLLKEDVDKIYIRAKSEKGTIRLVDAQGKAGEKLGLGYVEFKDGILPLLFVPKGVEGKDIVELEFGASYREGRDIGGKDFKVSLEVDLKAGPSFGLALADGMNGEELRANQPVSLVLEDLNFSKHEITEYKLAVQRAEKGTLHFMNSERKAGKVVESSDTIEVKDGIWPIIFVPNGKIGEDTVDLKLTSSKGESFEVSIELDLKSFISLEVPKEVKTSKLTTAYLKINADREEEYRLKSVRVTGNPVELTYDNGAEEGVWAEINPVRIGDKFKGGETELSIKVYGVHDKVEAGEGIFEPSKRVDNSRYRGSRELEFVFADSKGNEYTTKAEFEVEDISWDFELVVNKWGGDECDADLKFKEDGFENSSSLNPDLSYRTFKVLSFRSNDGTVATFSGCWDSIWYSPIEKLLGKNFIYNCLGSNCFRIEFDDMNISLEGKSTILTIKLEGPEGVVKSADLEVNWGHREYMLQKRIENMGDIAISVNRRLSSAWDYESYEAEDACKRAISFLKEVKFLASQVENTAILSKNLTPDTMKKIERALEWVEAIKRRIDLFNKKFGFNFVSPV